MTYILMFLFCFAAFLWVFRYSPYRKALIALYLYHSSISVIFMQMFIESGSDMSYYFEQATTEEGWPFGFGTAFVIFLTRVLSLNGALGIWEVSLIFNLLGSIGLAFLYVRLRELAEGQHGLRAAFPVMVALLPGLSFWTSAIGKDSLSFFAIALIIMSLSGAQRRFFMFLFGALLLFLIRPHVGTVMMGAVFGAGLTSRAVPFRAKAFILIAGVAAAYWILPLALTYVGLPSSISIAELAQYISDRQEQNQGQGASFDVSGQPAALAIFSFLFRPLFEIGGITGLMASFENLVLLAIVLTLTLPSVFAILMRPTLEVRANLLFVVFMLLMLAPITANSGIAVRQKTMILPSLFVLTALGAARRRSRHQSVENSPAQSVSTAA